MTERLYYDNALLFEFDAQVTACRKTPAGCQIALDRSAFYPTSGGQPFDTGWLNDVRITDVNVSGGEVWHTVDRPLSVGDAVHGRIDWPRRFDHMQQHAADHMIASALHRLMGGVTIGLHISSDVSTIDVAMPEGKTRITEEEISRIEADVNARVQRDVPIRCWFPPAEELQTLPLRKAPTVTEHVRIVAIGDDLSNSVLATMNLKELGVPYIVCKASDETHRQVLMKLGADKVVIPEMEHANRLAKNLSSQNVLDYIELSEEYAIIEVPAPKSWQGKTLKELNVRAKLGVNIIAVKRAGQINVSPAADFVIHPNDIMVVLGDTAALKAVQKL